MEIEESKRIMSRILALDQQGTPHRWISSQEAIVYHAKNLIAWQLGEGEDNIMFRGGMNRMTGKMSSLITAPIIAVKGEANAVKRMHKTPALTNTALFRRDCQICGYCGRGFSEFRLTRDHIVPTSRGGSDTWTNVITACERCNHMKDDRLLSECHMELLYVPYVPNKAEALLFENRNVLFCQMEYLASFIGEHSRIKKALMLDS